MKTGSWWRGTLGDVLTFHMWEKDNEPVEITLSIGLSKKVALTLGTEIQNTMGASAKFKLGEGNDEVGKSILYFWQNANNLDFQINDCTINLDQIYIP